MGQPLGAAHRWLTGVTMPAGDKIQRQQQLDRLRQRYAHKLPQRVDELQLIWSTSDQPNTELARANALVFKAHSLAGSASTFGYTSLGAAARRLELTLQRVIEQRQLDEASAALIDAQVEEVVNLGKLAPDQAIAAVSADLPATAVSDSRTVFVVDDDQVLAQEIGLRLQG